MAAVAEPPDSWEPASRHDGPMEHLSEDLPPSVPRDPFAGPWILKVHFFQFTGKHSASPVEVEDVLITNLGLDPENDPVAPSSSPDSKTKTAFLAEDVEPGTGQDVDFEAFKLVSRRDRSWAIVRIDEI